MKKKVSYAQLLKEAALMEYDPKGFDYKGPAIDPILDFDGASELETNKTMDAGSLLERFYNKERNESRRTYVEQELADDDNEIVTGEEPDKVDTTMDDLEDELTDEEDGAYDEASTDRLEEQVINQLIREMEDSEEGDGIVPEAPAGTGVATSAEIAKMIGKEGTGDPTAKDVSEEEDLDEFFDLFEDEEVSDVTPDQEKDEDEDGEEGEDKKTPVKEAFSGGGLGPIAQAHREEYKVDKLQEMFSYFDEKFSSLSESDEGLSEDEDLTEDELMEMSELFEDDETSDAPKKDEDEGEEGEEGKEKECSECGDMTEDELMEMVELFEDDETPHAEPDGDEDEDEDEPEEDKKEADDEEDKVDVDQKLKEELDSLFEEDEDED